MRQRIAANPVDFTMMKNDEPRLKHLVLGTRGSPLALWQSEYVRDAIIARRPDISVDLKVITTSGDKIQDVPLPKIGDKGLFTREIEQELLKGSIHLAVHSLKDLPTMLPDNLVFAGSPKRVDVRDAFISLKWTCLREVPDNGVIATGSVRRKALLKSVKPDLTFADLRGNIDTRIRKLEAFGYDGIIMAAAALKRLDREKLITEHLDPEYYVPAVGQGAIGIEINGKASRIQNLVDAISDPVTTSCCRAERAFMQKLEGGCSVSLGAWARVNARDQLILTGFVSSQDGRRTIRESTKGDLSDPTSIGNKLADRFIQLEARDILGRNS